jgi:type II secretion system protein H
MKRRTTYRRSGLGFSLIELMVVLVLIAILSAMIIPAMRGTYEDALLRSTARKLVDVFNLANSRAVTLNQTFLVRLNTTEGKYLLEPEKNTSSAEARQFAPFEGAFDKRISVQIRNPVSTTSQSEPDEGDAPVRAEKIAFYPDGTADNRELLLRDREGFQLALRLNPTTARIHIVEPARE